MVAIGKTEGCAMVFLVALLPATAMVVAGYVVLFLSGRSEGGYRTFGRYLAFWAFTLAGLVILGAIFAAAHFHHGMHGEGCWAHAPMERPGGEPPAVTPKSTPPTPQ
jgi:hypothetical protein